jgi:hypothetical protein
MLSHLRATHEHVLSLLGDDEEGVDEFDGEGPDDPDYAEDATKALLADLKAMVEELATA